MASLEFCPWCLTELDGANVCPRCGRDVNTYQSAPWHIAVGNVLATRYIVGRVQREDARAVTYLGFDQILHKHVDIREQRRFQGTPAGGVVDKNGIPAVTWGGDAGRQAFLTEARQVAQLSGTDALPAVVDLFVEGDSAFVVRDHAEGTSLLEIIQGNGEPYSFGELKRVMRPVFRSLSSLHKAKIAYGTVTPDGIVLTPTATLLVRWPQGTSVVEDVLTGADGGEPTTDNEMPAQQAQTVAVRPGSGMDAKTVAVRPLAARPEATEDVVQATEARNASASEGVEAETAPATYPSGLSVTVRPPQPPQPPLSPTVSPDAYRAQMAARQEGAPAPEAFDGTGDVASLCATAYQLLTGVDPAASGDGTPAAPSELGVEMPREAEEALMRGLGVENVPTMAELIDAWYGMGGLATTTVTHTVTGTAEAVGPIERETTTDASGGAAPATKTGANPVLIAVAAVALVAVIAVVAILLKPAGKGGSSSTNNNESEGTGLTVGTGDDGTSVVAAHKPSVSIGLDNIVLTRSNGTVWVTGGDLYGQRDAESWSDVASAVAGGYHVLGLKEDGTVVSSGRDYEGQCEVAGWSDVSKIAAGMLHSVALLKDGTVRAMGGDGAGQCEVSGWSDVTDVACGLYHTVGLTKDGTLVVCGARMSGQSDVEGWDDIAQIDAGFLHTVGLRSDGTCVAVGSDDFGQTDVEGWEDVEAIAAGAYHTVALTKDGTVLSCGSNDYGQCDVDQWKGVSKLYAGGFCTVALLEDGTYVACGIDAANLLDIDGAGEDGLTPQEVDAKKLEVPEIGGVNCEVACGTTYTARISGGTLEFKGKVPDDIDTDDWIDIVSIVDGGSHLVGLTSDGTVVATGDNDHGQCNVDSWTDVAVILAAEGRTVALRKDGTVLACGDNKGGACEVGGWKDVRVISVSPGHTVGLTADGKVLACGNNDKGQCDVKDWSDVVDIVCGANHTVGLRSDGTVVACGANDKGQCDVGSWDGVISVSAGRNHTLALREDGTVLACGANDKGQCDVTKWTDVKAVESTSVVDVTYALAKGGVALAAGDDSLGQCGIEGSEDLVGLYFGERHVVGRHMYLDYEAAGDDEYGQCDLESWNP